MGYAIFPGPDWVQVPAGHGSLRYLRKEHSVNQFCERKSCSRVDFNVPFSLKSKDHAGIGCWKQRESKLMALWNYSGERCFLDLVLNCTWVQWSGYRPKPQQSQSSLIRLVSAGAPSGTQPKFAQSLLRQQHTRKEDCHPPDQSSAAAGLWVHSPPRASPTDQESTAQTGLTEPPGPWTSEGMEGTRDLQWPQYQIQDCKLLVQEPIMISEVSRKKEKPLEMEHNQSFLITAIFKNGWGQL